MIRFADKSMIPSLKVIWQEAFGDDDAYISFFYENRFTESNTLVWLEAQKPVAMLTLLPAKIVVEGRQHPVKYIYGVATKAEYRGRGISTALVNYANEQADRNNEWLVLVPASESLFDFYRKCGYRTAFYLKELTINRAQIERAPKPEYRCSDIIAEEYKVLRDTCFAKSGYILWDVDAIDYVLRENRLVGGTATKITLGGDSHLLLYRKKDNILLVKETSLNYENLIPVLASIALQEECHTIRVRLPQGFKADTPAQEFGMLYAKSPVDLTDAYLNLVLD